MHYITGYIGAMLPYMLSTLPLIIISRWFWIRKLGKKNDGRTTIWHEAGMIIFFLYLTGLVSQAVIPCWQSVGLDTGSFNLIPFMIFADTWREAVLNRNFEPLIISLAGNIAIFIPMGFFIPWLWRKTCGQTVLLSFLASLAIEICQIPQARCSDIDDIWMNTLGGLTGWLIYNFWQKIQPEIKD